MGINKDKRPMLRPEMPAHHSRGHRIMDLRTLCASAIEAYAMASDVTRPSIGLVIARLQDEIALTLRKHLVWLREDTPLAWVDRWSPKDAEMAQRQKVSRG